MHARVPASPATCAAAPAWLASAEVATLRKQLKDQRDFVSRLATRAAEGQSAALPSAGGVDFQRAQRDPAYAKEIQAKLASMSQAEQMKFAMQMSQATSQAAVQDVKLMAADPPAVKAAADHYPDYQAKLTTAGIFAQAEVINDLRRKVSTREMEIEEKTRKALKCSDGEGGCATKADEAADQVTLRAAHAQIVAEYDKALALIGPQVEAARQSRMADIAAAQKDLAPAQYGAAAQSNANKQLLAAYHGAVLTEVEQLFEHSESVAKWAAARYQNRSIAFMPID